MHCTDAQDEIEMFAVASKYGRLDFDWPPDGMG